MGLYFQQEVPELLQRTDHLIPFLSLAVALEVVLRPFDGEFAAAQQVVDQLQVFDIGGLEEPVKPGMTGILVDDSAWLQVPLQWMQNAGIASRSFLARAMTVLVGDASQPSCLFGQQVIPRIRGSKKP